MIILQKNRAELQCFAPMTIEIYFVVRPCMTSAHYFKWGGQGHCQVAERENAEGKGTSHVTYTCKCQDVNHMTNVGTKIT